MSGHSKWSNIKRKKEVTDKAKGATFAKLSRVITLAVIEGGGIPDSENNVRLRLAIERARALNMPKENIARAVEKGTGENKQSLKEVIYEAFAPHGVALIITATTDNSNRTHAELRMFLERNGGKLGSGGVSYLFQKCGSVLFENVDDPFVLHFSDKISALDIEQEGRTYIIYFPFENLVKVKEHSEGFTPTVIETVYKPQSTVQLSQQQEEQVINLILHLEEMDDVQSVFSNAEFLTI